jgi:hypothetical protein
MGLNCAPMADYQVEFRCNCHCGALSARFRTGKPSRDWALRTCLCSFCRAQGAIYVSDPAGRLRFEAADPAALQRYRFGTRTLDFLLCRHCGVLIGVRMAGERIGLGVLNVLAMQPIPADLAPPVAMDYSTESAAARKARHQARWTPLEPGSL